MFLVQLSRLEHVSAEQINYDDSFPFGPTRLGCDLNYI